MDPRLLKLNFKTLLTSLADFLLPRCCLSCGRPLLSCEQHICTSCLADLPLTRFGSMPRNPMADRFNERIADSDETRYCYATALFYYDGAGGYDNITQDLKYRRNFGAGRHFARMLGKSIAESPQFADVDLVTCVPLHYTRSLKRGYNQAGVIAAEVARTLGVEFDGKMLARVRRTKSQAHLTDLEKAGNVKGAFSPRKNTPANHVLIIDDVFTTGTTLSECYFALREVYAPTVRISVATLAFAVT